MKPYLNPYSNDTFFGFFKTFFLRLIAFVKGDLPIDQLASDEIQVIVLVGVSASSALLGSFLVLRRMTMLANSLSHTILIGIVMVYVFTTVYLNAGNSSSGQLININAMLVASLVMGIVTTFLTEFLCKTVGLQEDASIGIVFSSLFAVGIIMVTMLTRNAHIGTEVVMGNVDSLQLEDCAQVFVALGLNVLAITLFYKEFQVTTFDQGLSKSLGISPTFYNYFLMTLVSATAISAFRAVGVLMVLSFITGPALAARKLTHNLKTLLLLAVLFGSVASMIGVALSRHLLTVYNMPLSTGGLIVCLIALLYALVLLFKSWQTFKLGQRTLKEV